MRRTLGLVVVVLLPWTAVAARIVRGEDAQPAPVGAAVLRGNPDGLGEVKVVEAFPGLEFTRPTFVGMAPDDPSRVYVGERDGVIRSFGPKDGPGNVRVFLDIKDRVLRSHVEEGLLGVAFHPAFKSNGLLYVAYTADKPARVVVSRFKAPGSRAFAKPATELVLFSERKPAGGNNGGCLAFGPDGFLYVSLGDGGREGDPDGNAQSLGSRLGKILRLDVDEKKAYSVPQDNPFLALQGARPEIWALGFRNVRRFSFDPVTGDLWAGDIGVSQVEEINVVQRGANHGWNLREGRQPFREGVSLSALVDPVLEVPHADARAITGGVVYRGTRLHDMAGAYLYGDQETGNLWALRWDGQVVKESRLLARGVRVSCFGTDTAGEVLLATNDGKLYALVPGTQAHDAPEFPDRLSRTGLFTDTAGLVPHASLVPYDVNVPLWSDGAEKQRWVLLPEGKVAQPGAGGRFDFPAGTIFVKHFSLGDPLAGGRRLETRLLALGARGWAGYTYVWDESQGDAYLIDGRVTRAVEGGGEHEGQSATWTFPSRSDCMSCHTEVAGHVLGFTAPQLERAVAGGGSQLAALAARGVLGATPATGLKAFPDWRAGTGDPDLLVRAYLDSNCAMCHQPGGPGNASIDLRWDTPLARMNLVDRRPGQWDLGVLNARLLTPGSPERSLLLLRMQRTDERGMPIVGHNRPDEVALERVAQWIRGLK